ncbi:23S rRNA (guanosine(2251)-2'-O)-methyltransferase RlmB [Idiomarina tyrosinivorans]|uniref:23S rRNA (guanosine-2'-O-)-methyltransferase RlmB n=1 Tax=Idiomarina tyrosinivorans TaxID=1445662 RepID=A0A432ZG49_9GAMM|nr:23S rRNA (guanosine(2251)-2'-O)-methyltransferase RlmB [Idiomarina tyrosinivorans]RUO76903.1 23S rRNA (guanosine(2251)-2'-O)-methyltransferase RlmB [Idiomarina tyrosinivorans]
MSQKVDVYGLHAVRSIVEHSPERLVSVQVAKERHDGAMNALISDIKKWGVSIQMVPKDTLNKRAEGGNHQGIIATVTAPPTLTENDLEGLVERADAALFLVLDGVTDPHNLGACLRTADAAGVTAVIVAKDKSAQLNATVRKVACGAAETVPFVVVTNLARALRQLQQLNVWVIGTAGEAEHSLYEVDYKTPTALVMGAEGPGMRRLTRETCDQLVSIPLAGSVSSLNVSVATGVCLFEAVRQRQ